MMMTTEAGAAAPLSISGEAGGSVDIANRRRFRRFDVFRAGKLLRKSTGRFDAFKTCDVSLGGVLVEVRPTRPVAVGEEVSLGIAGEPELSPHTSHIPRDDLPPMDARSHAGVLLREARMIRGVVVRSGEVDEHGAQRIAVRFAGRKASEEPVRRAA